MCIRDSVGGDPAADLGVRIGGANLGFDRPLADETHGNFGGERGAGENIGRLLLREAAEKQRMAVGADVEGGLVARFVLAQLRLSLIHI